MDKKLDNLFDDQFTRLVTTLTSQGRLDAISKEFAEKKSDEERMSFILGLDAVQQHVVVPELQETKSSEVASRFRTEGNQLFCQKKYEASVACYTRSVLHAPHYHHQPSDCPDSELALAYANRSAALFHLEQWLDCLADIGHALHCSYPRRLGYKLYTRKGQCLTRLGRYEDAVKSFRSSKEAISDAGLDSRRRTTLTQQLDGFIEKGLEAAKCTELLGNVGADPFFSVCSDRLQPELAKDCRNGIFPSLSASCDVTFSPDRGRYLVAKRDILPGEVVLVEKPYSSILLPDNYAHYCHYCYKFCYSLAPCPKCTEALYCSDACRMASLKSYHGYECGLLGVLQRSGVGKFGHLALRTILQVSCVDVIRYRNMLTRGEFNSITTPLLQGCDLDGLYLPTNYRTIHCLITHSDDRAVSDLFRRSVMADFLLKCAKEVRYFDDCSESPNDDVLPFVGGLLLSHLQSFPCNAHEIAEFELDKENLVESAPRELGAAIYSTLSLFNHSCDPAVNRNFYGDVCVVRAIKTIRRSDEISDNYGAVYAVHPREQRRRLLESQYYFRCNCEPCRCDWPLYPCIEDVRPTWRCTGCRASMSDDDSGLLTCERCPCRKSTSERLSTLVSSQEKYEAAFEKLMTCDVDRSLAGLLEYLRVLDNNICLPWREYNNCQEAVKQCFSVMSNCHVIKK
ncbi:hypothetical protein LSH36_330g04048 [Paralvinella palmiformis]|uniref:Protein-lysine N-methyltransferase SMYD4 n=1 Tax=Paralvinella palmiformis TaxID=53620 RepID=A0AAD9JGL2_9ANNE|nr:hypothetical protein LSH36_330g04048 [Paralvinella palmiformis]